MQLLVYVRSDPLNNITDTTFDFNNVLINLNAIFIVGSY